MNFFEAISSGFRNYVGFRGRASRSEFWWWFLFGVLVSIVASLIDVAIAPRSQFGPISSIIALALFLPGLAMAVRRLHDTDRSGWFYLLIFIPLVGAIILIVWFCTRGTVGQNRFGPDPLEGMM
jgi:uncharacterized membrane protein YhaH (DUF805 family)